MKTEIIYGIHPVFEALKAGRRKIEALFASNERKDARLEPLLLLAQKKRVPIKSIKSSEIKGMADSSSHQGIAAQVSVYPFANLGRISSDSPFLLILDSVLDPHNLGALLRSALSVGVDAVICPKDRFAPPSPAVSKVSAGALEHIKMIQVTNLARTIDELKKDGIWIAGLDGAAKLSIYNADFSSSIGLVIGGEEKGIRPLVKKKCDFLLSIPQVGSVSSLNASVAGSVVMYEAFRQRSL